MRANMPTIPGPPAQPGPQPPTEPTPDTPLDPTSPDEAPLEPRHFPIHRDVPAQPIHEEGPR
jgi:hypothetical protein